jgi:hypothetical protein
MKKTVFSFVILFLVAFCFIGCATQNVRTPAEVWRDVESSNDFIGKWEGSVIQNIPKNDDNFMPETSMEIIISFEYEQDSERVNSIIKVDFAQFLTDWSNMDLIKTAGLSKEYLWETLRGEFEKNDEVTVGGEYFIMQDLSDDLDTFFSDGSKLQINESGNKIKVIFPQVISFGMGDSGFTEIILDKK